MEKYTILLKYGEIALKGANKNYFETTLVKQIKFRLKGLGKFDISRSQSTISVKAASEDADMEKAFEICKCTFGIADLVKAYEAEKDIDDIKSRVRQLAPLLLGGAKTFKAEAKRSDKRFPLTSPQISAEVGGAVLEAVRGIRVDVKEPETVIRVEIRDEKAYITGKQERGAGGMPVGTCGRALLLLSGGIDSPVAGYMISKRGVKLESLHFESQPYTSQRALEKVKELGSLLSRYNGEVVFNTVSVTEIQEVLMQNCDEDYFTLLLRRFMMRIAEKVASLHECRALVTGESLGQVASQTMEAISVTDCTVNMPVFRPCIGMDKEEIVVISRRIGAFETSTLPFEDCCTVFTPRHPKTRPTLEGVLKEEAKIDVEGLTERAMATLTKEYLAVYPPKKA